MNGIPRKAPNWESPNLWLTNLRRKQQSELLKILSLKDRQRLAKTLPAKEGVIPKANKIKKSDKAQRKRGGRFREMGICLEAQQEIEKGLLPPNILGEISMSEVLTALEEEPGESKNLPFFSKGAKGGLIYLIKNRKFLDKEEYLANLNFS